MAATDRRSPRAILFDALGTLVRLEAPAPLLRQELAARFGLHLTDAEARAAIAAEITFYRAHLDEGRDPDSLAALRRRCAAALRTTLPLPEGQQIELDALTAALLASLRFTAFPDAGPALAAARVRGQRPVVVSNWDCSLPGVLAALGLAQLLEGVVTSAVAGVRKPAPEIFEQALRLAQAPAGDAIHVGDSLEEDVGGARAAGIEPVLVRRDGGPPAPGVRTIASLAELC